MFCVLTAFPMYGFSPLSLLFLRHNLFCLCLLLSRSFSYNKRVREISHFQTAIFCWWQLHSSSCSHPKPWLSSAHTHTAPVSSFSVSTFRTYPEADCHLLPPLPPLWSSCHPFSPTLPQQHLTWPPASAHAHGRATSNKQLKWSSENMGQVVALGSTPSSGFHLTQYRPSPCRGVYGPTQCAASFPPHLSDLGLLWLSPLVSPFQPRRCPMVPQICQSCSPQKELCTCCSLCLGHSSSRLVHTLSLFAGL